MKSPDLCGGWPLGQRVSVDDESVVSGPEIRGTLDAKMPTPYSLPGSLDTAACLPLQFALQGCIFQEICLTREEGIKDTDVRGSPAKWSTQILLWRSLQLTSIGGALRAS